MIQGIVSRCDCSVWIIIKIHNHSILSTVRANQACLTSAKLHVCSDLTNSGCQKNYKSEGSWNRSTRSGVSSRKTAVRTFFFHSSIKQHKHIKMDYMKTMLQHDRGLSALQSLLKDFNSLFCSLGCNFTLLCCLVFPTHSEKYENMKNPNK